MESIFPTLFPAADKSVWLTQVQKELKAAGTYERMRWHTEEGFTLDPYYTANDLIQPATGYDSAGPEAGSRLA